MREGERERKREGERERKRDEDNIFQISHQVRIYVMSFYEERKKERQKERKKEDR